MNSSITCRVCGKHHKEVPLSFAADLPDMVANLSESERGMRALIGSDQCIVDEEWFFLRGCLEIPIIGRDDVFLWGLWASIKEEIFDELSACWEEEGREHRCGPFKGLLANSLSMYPESLNLKLSIIIQPVGTRPLFRLEVPQHPIAVAQRNGISQGDAEQLAAGLLHSAE